MSPDASQPPSDNSLDRGTLIIAGVVIVGMVMSILDTTIVNVALDSLSRDLHSPLSTLQWVSTGYLLSLAMVIPLSHRWWGFTARLVTRRAAGSIVAQGADPVVGLPATLPPTARDVDPRPAYARRRSTKSRPQPDVTEAARDHH